MQPKSTFNEKAVAMQRNSITFKMLSGAARFVWRRKKVLLGILLVPVAIYGVCDLYASQLIKNEYQQIRQQNAPLRYQNVIRNTVPDSENAALLYIQASQQLTIPANYDFEFTAPQHQKDAIIRDNQQVMQLVARASALSKCHFPIPANEDPGQSLNPYWAKARELARFIALNAYDSARRNDYEKAFRQIGYINQLAKRFSDRDAIMGFLVARSVHSIGLHASTTILRTAPLNKHQAQKYFYQLPRLDWHQLMFQNLRNERTFNVSAFEYLLADRSNRRVSEDDPLDGENHEFQHHGFVTRPLLKMDFVYSLRFWKKVLLAAQQPGAINADYSAQIENAREHLPFYATGAKGLHETFANIFTTRDYSDTYDRQLEIAFALNAYKTKHGIYPSTLMQAQQFWGRPFSHDPFTDEPFLYRADKDDFTLYSVGKDRVDNGGIKQAEGEWDFSAINDVIFGDYPP